MTLGPVEAIDSLVVAGVAVDVSNAGTFPTLSVGQTVQVSGTYNNGVLTASQLLVVQPLASLHGFETSQDNHFDKH